jgi:hypothetical protein
MSKSHGRIHRERFDGELTPPDAVSAAPGRDGAPQLLASGSGA